jgi:hypothetical protein
MAVSRPNAAAGPTPFSISVIELRDLRASGGFRLGLLAQMVLLALGTHGADRLDRAGYDARGQRHDDRSGCGEFDFVTPHGFLKFIPFARWTRDEQLIVQMPFQVRGQGIRCLVTPRPVLLQTLHDDPGNARSASSHWDLTWLSARTTAAR